MTRPLDTRDVRGDVEAKGMHLIPMRQFLREHQITGAVTEYSPDPAEASPLDGASYRLSLASGPKAFAARLQRPMGAPHPTLGEAVAEMARRGTVGPTDPETSTPSTVEQTVELRQFLGDAAHDDLLFEFGRRPEDQVEQGDVLSDPARPDEMTNQEPRVLAEARRAPAGTHHIGRYVGVVTIATSLAAAGLFIKKRTKAALAMYFGGVMISTTGVIGIRMLRRRQRHSRVGDSLQTLTDQNAAIQTGNTDV
ncbi:MAG: hypothetical protein EPO65_01565 [Dehalococcoidia bacterium]|nr:MAG: hypothetical protein EPO65_01565 [Dehalococcoidia bacterium]